MMAKLRRQPGYAPITTNAHLNRVQAFRLFQAGFTPAEIAKAYPVVFATQREDGELRLGQRYTLLLDDGRKELDTVVLADDVTARIKRKESAD